jgi:hypothetical protein
MEQLKSKPCPYCGKTFKPRGLGTHIREAHGLKIKTVVKTTVPHSSTVVPHSSTVVPNSSTVVPHSSTVVQRPSDYVKKRSEVIETKIEPVFRGPDSLGRTMCKNCGGWYVPGEIPGGYNCVPGKRHEF